MTDVELSEPRAPTRRRYAARTALVVGLLAFAAFWIWALFFASKEPVNRIDDRAWAARAEVICAAADEERVALADFRKMDEATPEMVLERADIVDAATDILERMLDDVVADPPDDAKGRGIVPLWEDDYRTYLADRRAFTGKLRDTRENVAFYESAADGIPISEKLETFAADNHMPSCAPPRDLTR
jgi:hypothetical protein